MEMLERMGTEIFRGENPVEIKYNKRTQKVTKEKDNYIFTIYMPFTGKQDLELSQKGDEIIIKVNNLKRNITVPKTLLSLAITGAKFEGDYLKIHFGGNEDES